MENKESLVKATMESMDGIQRAILSPEIEQALVEKAKSVQKIKSFRPLTKWAIAASIILLAGLNIISIFHYSKSSTMQSSGNPVYKEYFSYLNEF